MKLIQFYWPLLSRHNTGRDYSALKRQPEFRPIQNPEKNIRFRFSIRIPPSRRFRRSGRSIGTWARTRWRRRRRPAIRPLPIRDTSRRRSISAKGRTARCASTRTRNPAAVLLSSLFVIWKQKKKEWKIFT